MSRLSDQEYLLSQQYRDASNLNARIQLHRRFSTNQQGWQQWVFEQFNLPPRCRILELGCGPADLWAENLPGVPEGWDITLSDFSEGMLERARANLSLSNRPFQFQRIDAQCIPFDDGRFDGVVANHVLHHVPDVPRALSEIRRVLKPGGRFYATTVGQTHMWELKDLLERFASQSGDTRNERPVMPFVLENGADQLSPWFSEVTLRRYEDSLVVTEAAPLVAYVQSMATRPASLDGRWQEFSEFVEQELATHGAIRITKDSGMFQAVRQGCADGRRAVG